MVIPFILAACFAGVLGGAPLAIYLLWLGKLHRRTKPTIISGKSDFTALLCGLSGLLGVGLFFWLSATQSGFLAWTRGNLEQVKASWGQERAVWLTSIGVYLTVVVGFALFMFLLRKRQLILYGIDTSAMEPALEQALANAGYKVARLGKRYSEGETEILKVNANAAMSAAVLALRTPNKAKGEELDRQLRLALENAPIGKGTVGAWIGLAAYGCGLVAICGFALIVLYSFMSYAS